MYLAAASRVGACSYCSLQAHLRRLFRLIVQVRHFAVSKCGGTSPLKFPRIDKAFKSCRKPAIKNQEHGIVLSAGVCDPMQQTGGMTTSRRRALSCPRMRTVGEGAAGRWVSLLCLLMCVATGEVLASQGGTTKGRAASATGAWPFDRCMSALPRLPMRGWDGLMASLAPP